MVKTVLLASLVASAAAFAPSSTGMLVFRRGFLSLSSRNRLFLFRLSRSLPELFTLCSLCTLSGRAATKLFEDAAAPAEEAAPEPAAAAAPSYVASEALPFLEYPPNLAGYVGDAGFDPLRFSDFVPMDFLREAELKHGRICMMATAGFAAVDCGLRVYPTPEAYEGLTSVTAHDALVKQGAMGQLLLWFSLAEIIASVAVMQMMEGSGRQPGDYGFDPIGFLKDVSKEKKEEMMLKELTNGRLAMIAFSGMVSCLLWMSRDSSVLVLTFVAGQVTQAVLTQGPFPYV